MLIPPEMLEAIGKTAADLPLPVVESVAGALAECNGQPLQKIRNKALALVGLPHFRLRVSSLFSAWAAEGDGFSPQEVAIALLSSAYTEKRIRESQSISLLWTGPNSGSIPLRRTDQALVELIDSSKQSLMIVSFAVYKFQVLLSAMKKAAERGVVIRFIIESSTESGRRLEFDGIDAIRSKLPKSVPIYTWPIEKREKDERGNLGVLHAKCAIADGNCLFVSSANLTQAAFSLNMELGLLIRGGNLPSQAEQHFQRLIESGILGKMPPAESG